MTNPQHGSASAASRGASVVTGPERPVAIAGGTSGLGLAIAMEFAQHGFAVSICGRRPGPLKSALRAIEAVGGCAWGQTVDVTVPYELDGWLDRSADMLGPVFTLVANAGGNRAPESWETTFADNVHWVVRAIDWAESNIPSGGSVVLVSSVAARLPQLGTSQAAYGASKAALEHLARHASVQLGSRGVRVNAVAPGPLPIPEGSWSDDPSEEQAMVESLHRASALGRFATRPEVAACISFLASPAASGVTGAVLRCDAGLEAHLP